jgi:hypothetical protein
MCGDMLSSAWESEQRQHDMIDWNNPKNNWMKADIRRTISDFQNRQVEKEFAEAVEQHRVEEVYWVGGEPLMYEQHWRYMQRIIALGDGPNLYARYNTNLSRIDYRGVNLFRDILCHVRDWQICASLDGTGAIGEYIRTGLDYDQWHQNFLHGLDYTTNRRQMRIDFTLTLPGLFEVPNIQQLADEFGVHILAKVVFGFSPEIILSPLALPRSILERKIQQLLPIVSSEALKDLLQNLLTRPTFQEQWPAQYYESLSRGKQRILRLESIRRDRFTLEHIFEQDREIYEWWKDIR